MKSQNGVAEERMKTLEYDRYDSVDTLTDPDVSALTEGPSL